MSVNDAFRPLSRFFDRVWRPEQLPAAMLGAMRVLTDPAETGAVTLGVAAGRAGRGARLAGGVVRPAGLAHPAPVPEPAALARAVAVDPSAQRPLLVAGGGVHYSEATEALRGVRRGHGIPVADTQAGKGAILWDHPQAVGGVGLDRLAGGQRAGPGGGRGDRGRYPVHGLHHRLADRVPAPGGAVRQPERGRHRRGQARRGDAAGRRPHRPGSAHRRAASGRAGYQVEDAYTERHRALFAEWNEVVDNAYHLGHQPLPAQTEILGRAERDDRSGRGGRAGGRVDAR